MIPNAHFIKCFDMLLFYLLQQSYESVHLTTFSSVESSFVHGFVHFLKFWMLSFTFLQSSHTGEVEVGKLCWAPVFRKFAHQLQKETTKTKYKLFPLC